MTIRYLIGKAFLSIPILQYKQFVYKLLGVRLHKNCSSFFMGNPSVIGSYSNIILHDNAEIERNSLLVAKDRIEIGVNSTLAYGVTILTHADPNGPHNLLSKIYPPKQAPVVIGDNCWIGANATLLPGDTIGDFSVIAAGAVVTKDLPSGVMAAGCPAEIKKKLINK